MRVGEIDRHAVGQLRHLRRQVNVVVEADDQWYVRPDGGADAAQQLALAILVVLGTMAPCRSR